MGTQAGGGVGATTGATTAATGGDHHEFDEVLDPDSLPVRTTPSCRNTSPRFSNPRASSLVAPHLAKGNAHRVSCRNGMVVPQLTQWPFSRGSDEIHRDRSFGLWNTNRSTASNGTTFT